MKNKDKLAVLTLLEVMLNRGKVKMVSDVCIVPYTIQSINLDGYVDLYSLIHKEVIHYDVSFKDIIVL